MPTSLSLRLAMPQSPCKRLDAGPCVPAQSATASSPRCRQPERNITSAHQAHVSTKEGGKRLAVLRGIAAASSSTVPSAERGTFRRRGLRVHLLAVISRAAFGHASNSASITACGICDPIAECSGVNPLQSLTSAAPRHASNSVCRIVPGALCFIATCSGVSPCTVFSMMAPGHASKTAVTTGTGALHLSATCLQNAMTSSEVRPSARSCRLPPRENTDGGGSGYHISVLEQIIGCKWGGFRPAVG